MTHDEAVQITAVEQYVLGELPPPLRDEFEEHFFDCQECAIDVKAAAEFIASVKKMAART